MGLRSDGFPQVCKWRWGGECCMICAGSWEFTSIIPETFADYMFKHPLCTSILRIQPVMWLSSNMKRGQPRPTLCTTPLSCHNAVPLGLQSALNPCEMLFSRPMGFRPDMSHSLPYMSNVNDLQTFLHLFRQILDVFSVLLG